MCLIALAHTVSEEFPLILVANRDEFYERPTQPMHFWNDEGRPQFLAGKDLRGGGTWMGFHKNGKWAALTNYRNGFAEKKDAPTRGVLVKEYLDSSMSPEEYVEYLKNKSHQYNGFNILLGEKTNIFHFSNASNIVTPISQGVHGVSNALLNTSWPKLDKVKMDLKQLIEQDNIGIDRLFSILLRKREFPDEILPKTGVPIEWERKLSSIFIASKDYGTRCSTIALLNNNGFFTIIERRFLEGTNKVVGEKEFGFPTTI